MCCPESDYGRWWLDHLDDDTLAAAAAVIAPEPLQALRGDSTSPLSAPRPQPRLSGYAVTNSGYTATPGTTSPT